MSRTRRRFGLTGAIIFLAPLPVVAAPFCVETQTVPPQCMYYDAALCQRDANHQGGLCTVNSREVTIPAGLGHFCLLTSGLASSCIYADRADCEQDALVQHGACVDAPARPESPAADPYRITRPSMVGGGG